QSYEELGWWAAVSLAAGIIEESVYRGVLFGILFYWLDNWWVAALLCSLSFALGHAIQGWKSTVIIFVMALMFHGLVRVTGSRYVAMVVHAAYDLIAGVAYASFSKLHARAAAPSASPA